MKSKEVNFGMKAGKWYFLLYCYLCCAKESFLLILLIKFSTCCHSNESYWAVLSCVTVYCSVHGGFNVWVHGWNPVVLPFKWDLVSRTFARYCPLRCVKWYLHFFLYATPPKLFRQLINSLWLLSESKGLKVWNLKISIINPSVKFL